MSQASAPSVSPRRVSVTPPFSPRRPEESEVAYEWRLSDWMDARDKRRDMAKVREMAAQIPKRLPLPAGPSQPIQGASTTGGDLATTASSSATAGIVMAVASSGAEKTITPALFAVEWRKRGKDGELDDWNKEYRPVSNVNDSSFVIILIIFLRGAIVAKLTRCV
jgi:hypothetical protein